MLEDEPFVSILAQTSQTYTVCKTTLTHIQLLRLTALSVNGKYKAALMDSKNCGYSETAVVAGTLKKGIYLIF